MYGPWWNLPQKIAVAPDGDLIMSNIYRGVLWRMRPDGSLPPEGWTSIYHPGRNEPFESTDWTQGLLMAQDLKNYMPFHSLRYPYFCFDPDGTLYISAGQSTLPTKRLRLLLGSERTRDKLPLGREPGRGTRGPCLEVPNAPGRQG